MRALLGPKRTIGSGFLLLTHKAKKKHIFILITFTKKRFKLTCKSDNRASIARRKDRHRKAIISIAKFEKERKYKIMVIMNRRMNQCQKVNEYYELKNHCG